MGELDGNPQPVALAVSIVVFESDPAWLARTLTSLEAALLCAKEQATLSNANITLVDNAAGETSTWKAMLDHVFAAHRPWLATHAISGQGNRGYGAANNLSLLQAGQAMTTNYVLVLNPDVDVDRMPSRRQLPTWPRIPNVAW